eukprot:scaffold218873_cov48-Prasinocladus_malaysianus.AAC.2
MEQQTVRCVLLSSYGTRTGFESIAATSQGLWLAAAKEPVRSIRTSALAASAKLRSTPQLNMPRTKDRRLGSWRTTYCLS